MDKMTLNYGRLHTMELKMSSNMLHKPEFVPLYRGLAIVTPRKCMSSFATDDMVSTAEQAV